MAYEESIRSISLNADSSLAVKTGVPGTDGMPADNSGNQYRFVSITGAHTVGRADANDTDAIVGVLQNKPQVTGEAATVAIRGVSKVRAAGAISAGANVYVDASGLGTATAGTSRVVGVALAAAGGADELIPVLLKI